MKHRVAGRKLGRTSEHRLALLRNLSTALFERERIKTTLSKAKELRPFAEKILTLSKRDSLHARRLVLRDIHDKSVVAKVFDTLAARYAQRPGGYTRIIKLGPRRGDSAEMALIELVDAELPGGRASAEPEKPSKKASRAKAKEQEAAAETAVADKRPAKKKTAKKKATKKAADAKPRAAKKKTAKKKAAKKKEG